jgi:hypothetical protein
LTGWFGTKSPAEPDDFLRNCYETSKSPGYAGAFFALRAAIPAPLLVR